MCVPGVWMRIEIIWSYEWMECLWVSHGYNYVYFWRQDLFESRQECVEFACSPRVPWGSSIYNPPLKTCRRSPSDQWRQLKLVHGSCRKKLSNAPGLPPGGRTSRDGKKQKPNFTGHRQHVCVRMHVVCRVTNKDGLVRPVLLLLLLLLYVCLCVCVFVSVFVYVYLPACLSVCDRGRFVLWMMKPETAEGLNWS